MRPARGFIALISVVVISVILLGAAATLSQGVFFTRFDGLNGEYHSIARSLAEGCIQQGLINLRDDYSYRVQTDPTYNADRKSVSISLPNVYGKATSCELLGPTTTPTEVNHKRETTITARANFNHSFITLTADTIVADPSFSSDTSDPLVELIAVHEAL